MLFKGTPTHPKVWAEFTKRGLAANGSTSFDRTNYTASFSANADNLPIGSHHGSLSKEARRKVEGAMAEGRLRALVCTASLDLGIDWGAVDLVIQVGAPKNIKRLVQRIGRANHRYNAPSKALLVPANRMEVVECQAALEAARAHALDGEPRGPGPRAEP